MRQYVEPVALEHVDPCRGVVVGRRRCAGPAAQLSGRSRRAGFDGFCGRVSRSSLPRAR